VDHPRKVGDLAFDRMFSLPGNVLYAPEVAIRGSYFVYKLGFADRVLISMALGRTRRTKSLPSSHRSWETETCELLIARSHRSYSLVVHIQPQTPGRTS